MNKKPNGIKTILILVLYAVAGCVVTAFLGHFGLFNAIQLQYLTLAIAMVAIIQSVLFAKGFEKKHKIGICIFLVF